jgi:hypothetical protein
MEESSLWSRKQVMWGVILWVLTEEDVAVVAVLRDVVNRMQVVSFGESGAQALYAAPSHLPRRSVSGEGHLGHDPRSPTLEKTAHVHIHRVS